MELQQARFYIAQYSLHKAAYRVETQKLLSLAGHHEDLLAKSYESYYSSFEVIGSQVADDRILSCITFTPDGNGIVVGSWTGKATLWSFPDARLIRTYEGHSDRVNSVDCKDDMIATASMDNTIKIWRENEQVTLIGHEERVNRALFHPLSPYMVSCSHDMTIRLWDLNRRENILTQEGHARGVYSISIHPDGGLVVGGDLAGIGTVWDFRTGKRILLLKGHVKQILAVSVSPNGHTIATGSDDNTVKIWDLRKQGLVYSLPAHTKLVSAVACYEGVIATASFDNTAKLWSAADYSPLVTFNGDNKFTDITLSPDRKTVATCSFDRTFKIFQTKLE